MLFVGLTPIAAVEAKRLNINVAGKIPQAERYAQGGPRHPGYQTGYRDDDRGYRKGFGHHKPHHGHRGKGRGHDRFRD